MKNFFDVIKYSLNIIFESFVYLFHEIKTLVLSVTKGFINLFKHKKKNIDLKTILLRNQSKEGKKHSKVEELSSEDSQQEHIVDTKNLFKVKQDIANHKETKTELSSKNRVL